VDDHDPVSRRVDVELHRVGSEVERQREAGERALG
jgi:hypothetical protein